MYIIECLICDCCRRKSQNPHNSQNWMRLPTFGPGDAPFNHVRSQQTLNPPTYIYFKDYLYILQEIKFI